MHQRAVRATHRYQASIDRAGWALALGSAMGGSIILLLLLRGGQHDPAALAAGWTIGSLFSAFAIVGVAGPVWLAMHFAGLRRAWHAALAGAITAMLVSLGAQTWGFRLYDRVLLEDAAWLYRLASALATSALLAAIAALIGLAMWRVAYRPAPGDTD